MKYKLIALIFVLPFLSEPLKAQESFSTRSSPLAQSQVRYKDGYIKVVYSQPIKRGRQIFGGLVPYGQVWRTGANEATEITITKDVLLNNQVLRAGTYSLFTIPNSDKWTIIINSDVGLWGSYNYSQKLDVMRFDVPVDANAELTEALNISFDAKNEVANLLIRWDIVKITIPLKFIN
jgi:hypothetical protein